MGRFQILTGDITSDELLRGHDLIVNPTNPQMVCGGGVAGAIFRKAGADKLQQYTQEHFAIHSFSDDYNPDNAMKIGEVRVTPGFNLPMDILFVQGPKRWEHESAIDLLLQTYRNMLDEIDRRGYKHVLVPSLGTGIYGFDHAETGPLVAHLITDFLKDKDVDIDFVVYEEENAGYYC